VNRSGPHGTIQYDYDICDVNYRRESESEAESDVLDAAEEEAKRLPVTKLHVACFDRMKKRKRFIETADLATDDSDDNEDVEGEVSEKEFLESFQNHLRRKRQRRKVRKAPDVSKTLDHFIHNLLHLPAYFFSLRMTR